jgi:uncharacterized protein (DUF1330 family)
VSAYVVSRLEIRDADAMRRYVEEAPRVVEAFGGRYLFRGDKVEALEGTWEHDRMVIVEFESREAALAWFGSDEYRSLRELRRSAAESVILLADGAGSTGSA